MLVFEIMTIGIFVLIMICFCVVYLSGGYLWAERRPKKPIDRVV